MNFLRRQVGLGLAGGASFDGGGHARAWRYRATHVSMPIGAVQVLAR
uniref:Uncharacterized protein n=1 Tax=Ralstonia solanacearum TaxID=305 RepID=A0A0S4TPZ3_RALSL|nr:protein of unknown function [Ralstonia solanacearum]